MWGRPPAHRQAEALPARPPIATQRLISGCTLRVEQSFDPVDVLKPLHDEHLTLTADPAAVFVSGVDAEP